MLNILKDTILFSLHHFVLLILVSTEYNAVAPTPSFSIIAKTIKGSEFLRVVSFVLTLWEGDKLERLLL